MTKLGAIYLIVVGERGNRTFRPLDVSLPGRFAHSLDVSPPIVGVSSPSAFYVFVIFHMGHVARVNKVDCLMD